jgi:hypothetical protein
LKPSSAKTGDLGVFIVAELNKRSIPLPKAGEPPRLPATWRTFTIELARKRSGLAVTAQGCRSENVVTVLFSLLSPLRVDRPFSKDNDRNFWFSIDGREGSFSRTDTGLVLSFIAHGVSSKIAESDQKLHLGFSKHPNSLG